MSAAEIVLSVVVFLAATGAAHMAMCHSSWSRCERWGLAVVYGLLLALIVVAICVHV